MNYDKLLRQLAGFEISGLFEDGNPLDPTKTGKRPMRQTRKEDGPKPITKYEFKDPARVWGDRRFKK